METIGERLKRIREAAGISQGELARKAGLKSQGTIGNIERGTRGYGASIIDIARVLNTTPQYLLLETNATYAAPPQNNTHVAQEPSNVASAPALGPSRCIPVVGHVKGGLDGYFEELQYPVGFGEGYVEYWVKDPAAYALRVKGDSMHPRYRAGEFIVVTPSIEAQPGRDVIVKLVDGRKLLKHLNWQRADEIQLLSINNDYAPTTLSLDEIISIERVAGGVPADAFQNHIN